MFKKLIERLTRKQPPQIRKRSAKRYDSLTKDEVSYIAWTTLNNDRTLCPDCQLGPLLSGPCGGASQNVMCSHCRSEFNLTFFYGGCIGERLCSPGKGCPDRARTLYGLV